MNSSRSKKRLNTGRTNTSRQEEESSTLTYSYRSTGSSRDSRGNGLFSPISARSSNLDSDRSSTRDSFTNSASYTQYAFPHRSSKFPLRSILLDERVNNYPQFRTHSQWIRHKKRGNIPHSSYDVDGDGYVSQEDYRVARSHDRSRLGMLSEEEREEGKRELLTELFERNKNHIHMLGPSFAHRSIEENVERMLKSHSFAEDYSKLKQIDTSLQNYSSETLVETISLNAPELTRHNYYTNKMDATAWNDIDAIPRSSSLYESHRGSRKKLMFIRKAEERDIGEETMRRGEKPNLFSTKRIALITNVAMENS